MPRTSKSPTAVIVAFFMGAPLAEADQSLTIAQAIVRERRAQGLKEPVLPLRPGRKRGRKPTQSALPTADITTPAPAAATTAAAPRTRRRKSTATAPTAAPPELPVGHRPLPPQTVDEE